MVWRRRGWCAAVPDARNGGATGSAWVHARRRGGHRTGWRWPAWAAGSVGGREGAERERAGAGRGGGRAKGPTGSAWGPRRGAGIDGARANVGRRGARAAGARTGVAARGREGPMGRCRCTHASRASNGLSGVQDLGARSAEREEDADARGARRARPPGVARRWRGRGQEPRTESTWPADRRALTPGAPSYTPRAPGSRRGRGARGAATPWRGARSAAAR